MSRENLRATGLQLAYSTDRVLFGIHAEYDEIDAETV
jgi:hypothetical protein